MRLPQLTGDKRRLRMDFKAYRANEAKVTVCSEVQTKVANMCPTRRSWQKINVGSVQNSRVTVSGNESDE